MRIVVIILLAFVLGCAWGRLCDFIWPYFGIKMVIEPIGAIYIGLAVSLRTKRWWLR